MKKFLLVLAVLALAGCDARTKELTNKFILPEELKECKVYALQADGGNGMYAMVCPNSTVSTSVQEGKTYRHTVTYSR